MQMYGFLEEMFDYFQQAFCYFARKDFEVEAFFCQFACIFSHASCLFGMVGDVADSVYPALYIVIFYGNADFFLVDVDFEVGVA